jgi:hypothetical protein
VTFEQTPGRLSPEMQFACFSIWSRTGADLRGRLASG